MDRKLVLIVGLAVLVVSSLLSIFPRYLEIRELKDQLRVKLANLEDIYTRYENQLRAFEEIRKVFANVPREEELLFPGVSIVKGKDTYTVRGKLDGKDFMVLMNLVLRNPNSYVEELTVRNPSRTPMKMATGKILPQTEGVEFEMTVRYLELGK